MTPDARPRAPSSTTATAHAAPSAASAISTQVFWARSVPPVATKTITAKPAASAVPSTASAVKPTRRARLQGAAPAGSGVTRPGAVAESTRRERSNAPPGWVPGRVRALRIPNRGRGEANPRDNVGRMRACPMVAVQVVSYRTRRYLERCLETVVSDLEGSLLPYEPMTWRR